MISWGWAASHGRASTAAWTPRSRTQAAEAERAPDDEVAGQQEGDQRGGAGAAGRRWRRT